MRQLAGLDLAQYMEDFRRQGPEVFDIIRGCMQDDDAERQVLKPLLVFDASIDCHEDIEVRGDQSQEFAVFYSPPQPIMGTVRISWLINSPERDASAGIHRQQNLHQTAA